MSDRMSFLTEADAEEINAAFRQLFATSLALANPPVFVRLYRNGAPVGDPVQVLVIPADRQSREASGAGALSVALDGGLLRSWAPWDVDRGDTVKIGSATAVIRSTPPVRNGIQDASYEMADGGGSNE